MTLQERRQIAGIMLNVPEVATTFESFEYLEEISPADAEEVLCLVRAVENAILQSVIRRLNKRVNALFVDALL